MDSFQSFLALAAILAPLVAAAAIAACGLARKQGQGQRLAMLGAAASFCAAATSFVRLLSVRLDAEAPLSLGAWLQIGPHDPFRIVFAMAMDVPAAALAAVMSLCTVCAIGANRVELGDRRSERFLYIGASLLLSASLAIAMSTNVAELFVFWQIAALSAYFMSSISGETIRAASIAKRFILTQRIAEFWLLCAVFAFAIGYRTLDFDDLFGYLRAHAAAQRFALVHFTGLCLLGACVGRCALIPFLGWIEGLTTGPALTTVLVEGICLMPAGLLLLIRFLSVLHAASAASAFAVFLAAVSAFFAAVCAWSESDIRRQTGFACASVFGIVVMGLSLPIPSAVAWGVVLTATFLPTSAAILGRFLECKQASADPPSQDRREEPSFVTSWAVAVSIVLLFSGICGQGGILAAGLTAVAGGFHGRVSLALALILALSAQFFAALAMTRAWFALHSPDARGVAMCSPVVDSGDFDKRPRPFKQSIWPTIVLAACGLVVGLFAGASTLVGRPGTESEPGLPILAGGSVVATLVGCLPALGGFLAGWQRPRRVPSNSLSRLDDGLLMRLGRNRFYCGAFLSVVIVLPVRGVAHFARLVDWFFIDGFISGAPASAVEGMGAVFEPIQGRSVSFYLTAATLGTALLAAAIAWLRY